jgi:hypothetical protein
VSNIINLLLERRSFFGLEPVSFKLGFIGFGFFRHNCDSLCLWFGWCFREGEFAKKPRGALGCE